MQFEEWRFPTEHIGRRVLFFPSIDSTNTYAMSLTDELDNDGVVVLANEQTAGRGQHGRAWLAAAGSSVLISVILFPDDELRRPAVLTAWAAASVCRLIENLAGLPARIKWPNDVLIPKQDGNFAKTCGILIEQQARLGRVAAVVGIGLNVAQSQQAFHDAGLPDATSLAAASGRPFDTPTVAKELIAMLDEGHSTLRAGAIEVLEDFWRQRLGLQGKMADVESGSEIIRGRLTQLSFEWLELELDDGQRRHFRPETVQHLHGLR